MKHLLLLTIFLPAFLSAQNAGTLDDSFHVDGKITLQVNGTKTSFKLVKVQDDGKILAIGTSIIASGNPATIVARFNPDGTLDPTFANAGIYNSLNAGLTYYVRPTDFIIQDDGKIVFMTDVAWSDKIAVFRLLPNGQYDPSFGPAGIRTIPIPFYSPYPQRFSILPDGKIFVAGSYFDYVINKERAFVCQILPDGSFDPEFANGTVMEIQTPIANDQVVLNDMVIQPDGKVILVGTLGINSFDNEWYICRLMPDGAYDPSFGGTGRINKDLGDFDESALTVHLLADGKIVVGGFANKFPGYHFTMLRFLENGNLDNSFGFSGKSQLSFNCCHSAIYDLVEQPDGKLIAAGYSADNFSKLYFAVARFKPNGLIDQTFGNGGKVALEIESDSSQIAYSLALQPDGKILVAGAMLSADTDISAVLVRLNPGMSVSTFSPNEKLPIAANVVPNPFIGTSVQVSYTLEDATWVTIQLYDLLGRKVMEPLSKAGRSAGAQQEFLELPWDLPSGQYLIRIETESGRELLKLLKH